MLLGFSQFRVCVKHRGKMINPVVQSIQKGLLRQIRNAHTFLQVNTSVSQARMSTVVRKRFYRTTDVVNADGSYEVLLDRRKLKTPHGNIFRVENELLALAVAAEWDSQKDVIRRSSMHLTGLCNTALDNPNGVTKFDGANYVVNFLNSDTILFHSSEGDLAELQEKEWGTVISWFKKKYEVQLEPTKTIQNPIIPPETQEKILRHLLSYDLNAIHGFMFGVEALKSIILLLACLDRQLDVTQAVLLSRLEQEYQTGYWGRVEWGHDVEQLDLQARVAASILFIQLNSMSEQSKAKSLAGA